MSGYYSTGAFFARDLGPDWQGYERLAAICEAAELTNQQARIVLLRVRGFSWRQIQDLLGIKHLQNVHIQRHQANRRLERRFPNLRRIGELARETTAAEAYDLLECVANVRGGRDHGPLLAVDNYNGERRCRTATLRARVLTVADLGLYRASPLEVLAVWAEREL